jgi:ribosomal protein S12 methylthiotransferase accessory factor
MAILSGLCEVIERDAIMIAWLNGLALPRVLPPSHDPVLTELYRRLSHKHLRATVLDATTDIGLPVRIALVENAVGALRECSVGMAARPDPIQAHRKALLEAMHTLDWLHQLQQRRPQYAVLPPDFAPQTFEEHVLCYSNPWAMRSLDIWRQGPWRAETSQTLPDTTPRQQLDGLVQRLAARDLEVLTVDVTLPDVAEAGLCVWRTVVPGLIPLTVGREACLSGTRLSTVPAHLGWPAHYGPDQWNPHPHPFP